MWIINKLLTERAKRGSVLLTSLVLLTIVSVAVVGTLQMSMFQLRAEHNRWRFDEAYRHAENSLHWAAQLIADSPEEGPSASFIGNYSVGDAAFTLDYMNNLTEEENTAFENAWVSINPPENGQNPNMYLVTASAQVGSKVRTIQALINKNPPSDVLDYEYFLNNWGWWWGGSVTGWGDNRVNWDFDFRSGPEVNGAIYANGSVTDAGTPVNPLEGTPPFSGYAGSDPVDYVHTAVPRSKMPNLADFTQYEQAAVAEGGALYVGAEKMVDAVHNNPSQPGLFLEGTDAEPIRLDGPVVIAGDVVIKGMVTGIGTLYVGGNLYLAGDINYVNGPDFSTPPGGMPLDQQNQWVADAIAQEKDLAVFAVRESVLAGDVNSSSWRSRCYNPSTYGLRNVGGEASLGADGIAHTPDDGIPYLDTDGDGNPDTAWYDADGDGEIDLNYDYANDLQMTDSRANAIYNYPMQGNNPRPYSNLATSDMNTMNGVYYTNHAMALHMRRSGFQLNGSAICRDEAIIYSGSATYRYDPRVHSRYASYPEHFIDLQLPVANLVRIESLQEIDPIAGYY